jgi:hypothetical protein
MRRYPKAAATVRPLMEAALTIAPLAAVMVAEPLEPVDEAVLEEPAVVADAVWVALVPRTELLLPDPLLGLEVDTEKPEDTALEDPKPDPDPEPDPTPDDPDPVEVAEAALETEEETEVEDLVTFLQLKS